MSDTRGAKLIFSLILLTGCMVCIVGCSPSARSKQNTDWVQNDSLGDFEGQSNRPPTVKVLWAMADILATQGKDPQCEFVLKRIIYEHPSFLPAYNSLAELKMRQGQTKEAVKTLREGLEIEPETPILLNNLGMCWMILKDNEMALEMFTKAAGLMPENPKYRANMAVALGLMGREEESMSLFSQVLPAELACQNLCVLQKTECASDPNICFPIEEEPRSRAVESTPQ
jgi:Flp pilus assembly protein TadD